MQVHQAAPGWQQHVIMFVVFAVVIALRGRRLMTVRPLKPEQLWIVPILYLVIVGVLFVRVPPSPLGWLIAAIALPIGAAAGWQRGKTMLIHIDPATGSVRQKGSIWALLTIAALVAVKMIAQTEGQALHFDVNLVVDGLAAFSLGLFTAQRLDMYVRARKLVEKARVARA